MLPCAFLVHDRKSEDVHSAFFDLIHAKLKSSCCNHTIRIITDRELAISNAIIKNCPTWNHFVCWNHLLQDVKYWLRNHGGKKQDEIVYCSHIKDLLESSSVAIFEEKYATFSELWSASFLQYFNANLKDCIKTKAGRWILEQYNLYNKGSGVTTNVSESFNAQLNRVLKHEEVRIDELLHSVYFLQSFMLAEVLRGRCGLGDWSLACLDFKLELKDVVFPTDVVAPDNICNVVRAQQLDAQVSSKQNQPESCNSNSGLASYFIKNNRVSLDPNLHCFIVQGLNFQHHAVKLFPLESCSCVARKNCAHIKACRLAIGFMNSQPKNFNLSLLRKNSRGRNRSGRKKSFKPKINKNLLVQAAPDSLAAQKISRKRCGSENESERKIKRHRLSVDEKVNHSFSCESSDCQIETASVHNQLKLGHLEIASSSNEVKLCHMKTADQFLLPWIGAEFPDINSAVTIFNCVIQRADWKSLNPETWLSDVIIDSFLLYCSKLEFLNEQFVKILPFEVNFSEWLNLGAPATSYSNLWVQSVNPNEYDIWIIPSNLNSEHWVLNIVFLKSKIILYFGFPAKR